MLRLALESCGASVGTSDTCSPPRQHYKNPGRKSRRSLRPYVQIREFGNRSVDHVKTPVAGRKVEQIGTFNGLSPFIAPLSRRLSFGMEEFEFSFNHPFPQNLLFCLCAREV